MYKFKSDKELRDHFKSLGVVIFNKLPKGWKKITGATTAPRGYYWAYNGKSLFSNEYRQALVKR